jgi:hypothetical protein
MSNVLRENYSKVSLDDALLIQIIMIMVVVVLMYNLHQTAVINKMTMLRNDEALPPVAWASTGNLLAPTPYDWEQLPQDRVDFEIRRPGAHRKSTPYSENVRAIKSHKKYCTSK